MSETIMGLVAEYTRYMVVRVPINTLHKLRGLRLQADIVLIRSCPVGSNNYRIGRWPSG